MDEIIKSCIPEDIKYLAKILNNAGYSFFIVGGFVRDIFTGSCDAYENDIDTCGDCTPDLFSNLISGHQKIKLCEANYPLGTLKILIGHLDIEYTCFRKESYRGDGHHTPTEIQFTKNIYDDASRRDFTVNSLYLDPLTCEITDFFDGVKHIRKKLIKTVRESRKVFTEDALRILRMCRFSAKLGFKIERATLKGATECAPLLKNISKERIGVGLDKIIWDTEYVKHGISAIFKTHINDIICPEVKIKSTFILKNSAPTREVRWAVFLRGLSAENAKKFILNLSLGRQLADDVSALIQNKNIAKKPESEIILFFAKLGEKAAKNQVDFLKSFQKKEAVSLLKIYKNMLANKQFIKYNSLQIAGDDIINIFKVTGPEIKKYKDAAYEYAVLNPEKNNFDDLCRYLKSI